MSSLSKTRTNNKSRFAIVIVGKKPGEYKVLDHRSTRHKAEKLMRRWQSAVDAKNPDAGLMVLIHDLGVAS